MNEELKPLLMIVEDEDEVSALLREVMEGKGYRCTIETCGDSVLSRVRREQPDLILMDIKLVGMDGFSVCRRLKQDSETHDIPVIFISALNTERDVMEAMASGGFYFISKPFDLQLLHSKIKEALLRLTPDRQASDIKGRILYVCPEVGDMMTSGESFLDTLDGYGIVGRVVRDPSDTLRMARMIQPDGILLDLDRAPIKAQNVVDAIEKTTQVYLAEREEGERFLDTYRRIGMDKFKEAIYA